MLKDNIYIIILSIYILVLLPDLIKVFSLVKRPPLNFNFDRYFYKIHVVALTLGLFLLCLLISFEINFFNYSKPIEYKFHKEIGLKDFNGFKLPGQTLQGGSEFAFITTNIEYEIGNNNIDIRAYFHPARSYVYIDDLENEDLLRHEIYHFHITEIWAREFRKKVSQLKQTPTNKILKSIYKNIIRESNLMQTSYDYDSNHGYLLGNQISWQNRVDSLLNDLKDFKNSDIDY